MTAPGRNSSGVVEEVTFMSVAIAVPESEQLSRPSVWRKNPGIPPLHWCYPGSSTERKLASIHFVGQSATQQPRHRHAFEQLRYVISGTLSFGRNQTLHAGDCVYFPEAVPYGPASYEDGATMINLQWPGPSEHATYYDLIGEMRPAAAELLKGGGEFDLSKGGVFRHPDGRIQDGYEAVAEFLHRGPITYAQPRYDDQVVVHGSEFPAFDIDGAPGANIKHLGYFNEYGPNVKLLILEPGATLPRATAQCQQLWNVLTGEITYDGQPYSARALLHVSPGARRAAVHAVEPSEVLVTQFSALDGRRMPFSEF
jgi:quercetin dioxygenase-like cupin family protein